MLCRAKARSLCGNNISVKDSLVDHVLSHGVTWGDMWCGGDTGRGGKGVHGLPNMQYRYIITLDSFGW